MVDVTTRKTYVRTKVLELLHFADTVARHDGNPQNRCNVSCCLSTERGPSNNVSDTGEVTAQPTASAGFWCIGSVATCFRKHGCSLLYFMCAANDRQPPSRKQHPVMTTTTQISYVGRPAPVQKSVYQATGGRCHEHGTQPQC